MEHRLIHRTLASLDEQRKAAGLAPLATPVGTSPRSAQANAQVQQQQYSQKSAMAQAGSAQVKAATEANFAAKKTISDLSSLYENGSFSGTSDQMAELNDAQGKLNYTNKTLDAQSNIAANAADTSGKKTLDALALAGQQQSYDPTTGITQLSGEGNMEQAAITRLRESGLNDQQIAEKMKDPEYMNAIRTTMSNTGLESTARQSAVLTPAQAQNILATSRSPKERAAAQKVIDDQVNNVKGYDQVPQYDKDGQIVGYSNVENSAKTQENQQKEKDRLALEESNRLKAQESKDALKKFTAGVDPAPVGQTKTQIDELMASIKNLSPDLQAAVLPSLISLQQSNNDITKEVNNIIGSQPTDEEIQANYGSLEKYIQSEDAKYKALIERNMETAKEVSAYNRDMLEAEKSIIEHDASIAEQKQVIANAEGEKQLRRQLNRLGIQTDVQGLTYLQNEVQKGVDALENLKTANNLVSLKAQLAIGEGYRLEVKQAMETYEGNYLNITSQTTERLNSIKNSISTAKADRNKEIKEARKWGLEQKNANDRELRATIAAANDTMATNVRLEKQDATKREENALDRIDYLLKNYPRESVAEAIRQLGKDVTSFDVQTLIDNPTNDEIKKSKAAFSNASGSGYVNGYLPSNLQIPQQPTVSFDEYTNRKLEEMQATEMQSFNPEKKAKVLFENAEKWEKEYNAIYMTAPIAQAVAQSSQALIQQFGQPTLDAAMSVMDGTYGGTNPTKNAAKAFGVSEASVATALTRLRQTGAVADTSVLTPDQQKSWNGLRKSLESDPYYTTYNGAKIAMGRINAALNQKDGVSDIAAINAFQNGIVDPGATVRSEDVALIQSAMSWAAKVDLNYWREKVINGAKLPQEVREQMAATAKSITGAYQRSYADQVLPKYKQEVQQAGLPQSVLQQYGEGQSTTVDPSISSFVDSLQL